MAEKPKILVIDDEEGIRISLKDLFQSEGYEVYLARIATEAYEILEKERIDVVICDILLPDITGREIFRYILQNYPHIPVIILSVVSNVNLTIDLTKKGVFDYIIKPYEEQQLLSAINKAITHKYSSTHTSKKSNKEFGSR